MNALTARVGLIAFIPVVGLAVVPLQLVALLVRGVLFEYIGLAALGSYVTLFSAYRAAASRKAPLGHAGVTRSPMEHPV